jgi:hypothetical protein
MKLSSLVSPWCARLPILSSANASAYVVTLEEVGPNVVATGSGQIDLTGLTQGIEFATLANMEPSAAEIMTGPVTPTVQLYTGISGPGSFGPGELISFATSGTGDGVGVSSDNFVYVPAGYSSDSPLNSTSTYDGATFATLGATPGTYVWTWGSGANQSFTLKIGQTSCCQTILRRLGLLGWRRKQKAQTI